VRASILAIAAAATLLTTPAAFAAPTCQDRNGDTIRCGTPGAMPVGWTLSPQARLLRGTKPSGPTPGALLAMISIVGGLFALIALMPDFDGWHDGDWDKQEGEERG
jgi:hypothetical protein